MQKRSLFVATTVAATLGMASAALAGRKPAAATAPSPTAQRAAAAITEPSLRAGVKFLASDLLEGRAPASRGDMLAEEYIATELESLGLEGGAPGGGFIQKVPLIGVLTDVSAPLRFTAGGQTFEPTRVKDYVVNDGDAKEKASIDGAEIVFVGYGIVAPEYGWDDYKDTDVHGKVVLVMNNDPESDPALFAGKTRLYYGRWTYKYEEAARHGALGAIIVHTTPSASYPWQVVQTSWSGEQFELPAGDESHLVAKLWTTEDASRRLVAMGGKDLDALRASAEKREFVPVPIGTRMSIGLANRVRRVETGNVIARLPGRDAKLGAEAVLYTAHHDHLGVRPGAVPGEDAIFNGAVDNATGVSALLAIARAFTALPQRPARSVYFAALAAEEQGTLGSEWLARNPPVPAGRLVADINMDAMNVFGRTHDVTVVGLGKSTLDDVITRIAHWQHRVVKGDAFPDRGSYYRSDHFPLAKVGVPALYAGAGNDFVGRPAGWGVEQVEAWGKKNYHQPSDEWRDDYDLSGMAEDARLLFFVGDAVASGAETPRWRPGDEFEAARKKAIQALGSR